MVALFKDRSPANVVWLIVLSFAIHSHFFLVPPQVVANNQDGLISIFLNQFIAGLPSISIILIYHALVLGQAIRLNFLFNDQRMFSRANFLTALAYILLTAVLPEWNHLTPALIANSLLIWLFARVIRLYNNPNPKTLLFNVGLIIGVSVILYHPTALLVLVAAFALLAIRTFNVTEWLVLLMGILAPFYFLGSFLFLTDRFAHFYQYLPQWHLNLPNAKPTALLITTGIIVLLILVIGMYQWQTKNRRMLIQVRKNWGVLFVMLLVMLPLPFINEGANLDILLLWTIPIAPFIANAFLSNKKDTVPNIIFWIMVALALTNNWIMLKF